MMMMMIMRWWWWWWWWQWLWSTTTTTTTISKYDSFSQWITENIFFIFHFVHKVMCWRISFRGQVFLVGPSHTKPGVYHDMAWDRPCRLASREVFSWCLFFSDLYYAHTSRIMTMTSHETKQPQKIKNGRHNGSVYVCLCVGVKFWVRQFGYFGSCAHISFIDVSRN